MEREQNNKKEDNTYFYRKMVEEVQDYAIILLSTDGIIQNWNKGAQHIKQYSEAEAVGQHFRIFYLPEDRATGLPDKLLHEAMKNGRALHEGWRVRKDGSRFWGSITITALHNQGDAIIGFSKVTRDLTERKNLEDELRTTAAELQKSNEALRKSEDRYLRMTAEVQDYAIILLNENGDIQNWNAGAEKIKGYKAEEVLGRNFRIFYLQEDQATRLPEKLISIAVQHGRAIHEGWRVRKDGSTFWGSIVITALHDDQGMVVGFSKVTRDLTEKKIAEDKMREYMQELEWKNKELEQFAYVASHDLQEPLRKIRIFTDVIEHNLDNKTLLKKYCEKIGLSAKRMSELIRSILNYSHLSWDGSVYETTDLNITLAEVKSDLELLISEKNALIVNDPLPTIHVIPLQAHQLFANIIGNALKFTDKPPVVTITCRLLTKDQIKYAPSYLQAPRYLEIIFQDNGIGFSIEYEQKIFNLFQRLHTKHEFPGTGIGLALCKRIMENHRGHISATGEPGKGASFSVYFPV